MKQEEQLMQEHKNKYRDMQIMIFMHSLEVNYLQHLQVNMTEM